jgi:hypothetical protein
MWRSTICPDRSRSIRSSWNPTHGSSRNANLLLWHRRVWLIDHGAALYFHHAWRQGETHAANPFKRIKDHVLLRFAGELPQTDVMMQRLLTADGFARIVELIPDAWLADDPAFDDRAAQRRAYFEFLQQRLLSSHTFVEEAIRARHAHL